MKHKKVVVIGSGVIGTSIAYYAALRGHSVTVLDRSAESAQGCSFGNAGMIVPSHFVPLAAPGMVALGLKWMWNPESPFYIRPRLELSLWDWAFKFWLASSKQHVSNCAPILRDLHLASRSEFEMLSELPGMKFALERKGLVMLCRGPIAMEEETLAAIKACELGVPTKVLSVDDLKLIEPSVKLNVCGAVHYPNDCSLTPSLFVQQLRTLAQGMGVNFIWNTEAHGLLVEGRRIQALQSSMGDFEADEFVIAGGAWSDHLARSMDLKIPMQAGKGYSLTLDSPKVRPSICSILTEARIAVTPMGNSLRVGGTMELAGLNENITEARVRGIARAFPTYYSDFRTEDFASIKPWVGLRPCSPDGMPYLGKTQAYSNLNIATGHAMMGLSLGPITGKLMAQIISEELPSMNLQLLSPDRYA